MSLYRGSERTLSCGLSCVWMSSVNVGYHSSCWKPNVTGCGRGSNQCWGRGPCLKPREHASCSKGIWFLRKHLPVNHPLSSSFLFGNTRSHEDSGWSFFGSNHGELKSTSLSQSRNLGRAASQPQREAPAPEEADGDVELGQKQLLSFQLPQLARGCEGGERAASGKGNLQLPAACLHLLSRLSGTGRPNPAVSSSLEIF